MCQRHNYKIKKDYQKFPFGKTEGFIVRDNSYYNCNTIDGTRYRIV